MPEKEDLKTTCTPPLAAGFAPALPDSSWTRRRALKTLFCSSTFLALNLQRQRLRAADLAPRAGERHWLAIGDFGSAEPPQAAVAGAMQAYLERLKIRPEALLLLGDNFYNPMPGGLESPRWKTGFEDMYPEAVFPGPCPAVLGNHDYHDNPGGEKVQLAYAQRGGTRWTMPAKWYRLDCPAEQPLVTFLFLDTNLQSVNGRLKNGHPHPALTAEEEAAQWAWLDAQLGAKPRAPWTFVVGHHPVYSNGAHGDTPALVEQLGPRLEKARVPLYLCGHDHDQQHLELEGLATSFVLSGCGGAKVRDMRRNDRGPYTNAIYGFTHLQVSEQRLVVRQIDTGGKQLHAFARLPDGRFTFDVG